MRVLITGASGFVGSHLAEYILSEHSDCEVFGVKRWRSARSNYLPYIQWFECDLTDDSGIRKAIKYVQPDKIFHLAAQSVCEDEYLPIMKSNKILVQTFGDLWKQTARKNKIRKEVIGEIETEIIEIRGKQTRAIGYFNGMGNWARIKQITR